MEFFLVVNGLYLRGGLWPFPACRNAVNDTWCITALRQTSVTHQIDVYPIPRISSRKRLIQPLPVPKSKLRSVLLSQAHHPVQSPSIVRCSLIWYGRVTTGQPEGSLCVDRLKLPLFFSMSVSRTRKGPDRCLPPIPSLSLRTAEPRGEEMN